MEFWKRKKYKKIKPSEIPHHTEKLSEDNFRDFIEKYPISFIDFWAPWCAPCKKMNPRIRRLSKLFEGQVAFGKVNTQRNQDIAKEYKIMSIPTFILFKNGKEKAILRGVQSVGEIKKTINKFI